MARNNKNSGLWAWILIALIVAALAVGILYYLGWFDSNTHVDTPAGDNVEQTYRQEGPNTDNPGVQSWQNDEHLNLREVIVDSTGVGQ